MNPLDRYEVRVVASLPTRFGEDTRVQLIALEDGSDPHMVLDRREPGAEIATVRVHSACFTGDVFASLRCDCGPQLERALEQLGTAPWGVLVYAVEHEGRGIGLEQKLKAYKLQEAGINTFEANRLLGHSEDLRSYQGAAAALRLMGVERLHLLSANPHKVRGLTESGLDVLSVQPVKTAVHPANQNYQATKAARYRPLLCAFLGEEVGGDAGRIS